jgi:cysteine-rich repeat protein
VTGPGDLDGDGIPDLIGGADLNDDGGPNRGALWLFFMRSDGKVKSHARISDTQGGFGGALQNEDRFGRAVTSLGDLDDDGMTDLAVGTIFDDGGGSNRGAVWNVFLETSPATTTTTLAPVCGDGIVSGGEGCDDANTLSGDGCSDVCECEPVPDADGDGLSDVCDTCPADAQNDADGDGICGDVDACPLDPKNDQDADGICGDTDNCPALPNPDQTDSDSDGFGDPCDSCPQASDLDADCDGFPDATDVCTNIEGGRDVDIHPRALFRFVILNGPSGNEAFQFSGEFKLPASAAFGGIDPLSQPVRLRVEAYSGDPILDASLPTTTFAGAGTAGWKPNRKGTRWLFKDRSSSPADGIVRLRLDDRSKHSPRQVRVIVRGKNGTYSVPFGVEPIRVFAVVGDAAQGMCGETVFTQAECQFLKGHASLLCEP